MHNFRALNTKDWVHDYGFSKALAANPGTITFGGQVVSAGRKDVVAYWQREKAHYSLWKLLCYMGRHTVPQTLAYFDLPADTVEFVRWVYNHVSYEDSDLVAGQMPDYEGQMNLFPYAQLYDIWHRETDEQRATREDNVLVYLDRITEADGRELVRLSAPMLYE